MELQGAFELEGFLDDMGVGLASPPREVANSLPQSLRTGLQTVSELGVPVTESSVTIRAYKRPLSGLSTERSFQHEREATEENDHLDFKTHLLLKISYPKRYSCLGTILYGKQLEDIKVSLLRTIDEGVNEAFLVLGPPGSGKKTILTQVLDSIREGERKAGPKIKFSVVTLNGLWHSTSDDAVAEIILQLSAVPDGSKRVVPPSIDRLGLLMDILESKKAAKKSLVVVLENFEHFAKQRQATLYKLLDMLQESTIAVAVVGLTSDIAAVENLEKRIRSRFSSRISLIPSSATLEDYLSVVRGYLLISDKLIRRRCPYRLSRYNSLVGTLIASKPFQSWLESHLVHSGLTVSWLMRVLYLVASGLRMVDGYSALDLADFERSAQFAGLPSRTTVLKNILKDLAVIEIALLLALRQLHIKQEMSPETLPHCTFEMIYREYVQQSTMSNTHPSLYSRRVCLKAFQNLLDLNLVEFTDLGERGKSLCFAFERRGEHRLLGHQKVNITVPPTLLLSMIESGEIFCPLEIRVWGLKG